MVKYLEFDAKFENDILQRMKSYSSTGNFFYWLHRWKYLGHYWRTVTWDSTEEDNIEVNICHSQNLGIKQTQIISPEFFYEDYNGKFMI